MNAQFLAATVRLDTLLQQHFPNSTSPEPEPLRLAALDCTHFIGSRATFNPNFGSLLHRRWLDWTEFAPAWLTVVGQAVTDLERTMSTPTQANLFGELLTRRWVKSAHLADEPDLMELPSVNAIDRAWPFRMTLSHYDSTWLSPLLAAGSEHDVAISEGAGRRPSEMKTTVQDRLLALRTEGHPKKRAVAMVCAEFQGRPGFFYKKSTLMDYCKPSKCKRLSSPKQRKSTPSK